jgi:nucleoside 2-deoxyribosyltransferase
MFFHVVMPVGSNPNKIENQQIISVVADDHNIAPHFPRYATDDPVFNLPSALQDLRRCEFVLADLSLERPSCYYELGLAEALEKPVYLIAMEGTDIHQTASRKLVSFYKNKEELLVLLRNIFSVAVNNNG